MTRSTFSVMISVTELTIVRLSNEAWDEAFAETRTRTKARDDISLVFSVTAAEVTEAFTVWARVTAMSGPARGAVTFEGRIFTQSVKGAYDFDTQRGTIVASPNY